MKLGSLATFSKGNRYLVSLIFYLKDIRETVGELKGKGVAFLSEPAPPPDPPGMAVAQGPDGILIEFLQR